MQHSRTVSFAGTTGALTAQQEKLAVCVALVACDESASLMIAKLPIWSYEGCHYSSPVIMYSESREVVVTVVSVVPQQTPSIHTE